MKHVLMRRSVLAAVAMLAALLLTACATDDGTIDTTLPGDGVPTTTGTDGMTDDTMADGLEGAMDDLMAQTDQLAQQFEGIDQQAIQDAWSQLEQNLENLDASDLVDPATVDQLEQSLSQVDDAVSQNAEALGSDVQAAWDSFSAQLESILEGVGG